MRKIIHINNTYITSLNELKDIMRSNYLDQSFRRDILSFYKDGVLQEWFNEEGEKLTTSFSPEECLDTSDNDVYSDIHYNIVGHIVQDQIKSDLYTYIKLENVEYQLKGKPAKSVAIDKNDGCYYIPKFADIVFKFKIIKQDNNSFVFHFNGQKQDVNLKGKKRGSTFSLTFDYNINKETSMELVEGKSNHICTILINEKIPDSIKKMINSMRPVKRCTKKCHFTETMITQKQYYDVMGYLPKNIEGGVDFPIYLNNEEECQDFINRLNSLTKRKFQLPDQFFWSRAVNSDIFPTTHALPTHSIRKCHDNFPNDNGIYNMSWNIAEFLAEGLFVSKNSNEYNISNERPNSQIGFHLIEEI